MPIQIVDIDHIVLLVEDVDHAISFYCDALGCTMDRERADIGLYHLRAGSAFIDLVDINGKLGRERVGPGGAKGRNVDHFALSMAEFNEKEIRAHLASHGIDAGEVVERYGSKGSGPSIYIIDPDGNTVELKGPKTSSGKLP